MRSRFGLCITTAVLICIGSTKVLADSRKSDSCNPKEASGKTFSFPRSIRSVRPTQLNDSIGYTIDFDSSSLTSMKVRKYPAQGKSRGTVLFMCGGPDACNGRPSFRTPPDVDVIQFDYLGIGDNAHVKDGSQMTLESQAEAAKAVVKALHLKDYVLAGWSFGTSAATVAAAKIADDPSLKHNQPKSVLLDSTSSGKSNPTQFQEVSKRAWDLLSENERSQFRNLIRTFKTENPDLAGRIGDVFLGEDLRRGARFTAEDIREVLKQDPKKILAKFKNTLVNGKDMDDAYLTPLYRAAGCEANDHRSKSHGGYYFEEGLMPETGGDAESYFCKCRTSKFNFDASKFKIRAPVIYVNGTADPVTPHEGARKHFENQDQAPFKTFISVQDGGHTSMARYLGDCFDQIYGNAFNPSRSGFAALPSVGGGCQKTNSASSATETSH